MPFEIPKEDAGSLEVVRDLPSASFEKLLAALSSAPINSNPHEMTAHIAKDLPSIPTERLEKILETLYTLYHIRELSGVKPARFIKDLMDAIRNNPNLPASNNKELLKLERSLERLMSIDTLRTVSKAARLQRDGERLYCVGKILSDIRPIFDEDPSLRPAGAVLTHTLKLGYHQGAQHREFHVVLDSDDLRSLADVIRRAQAKDKTLRGLLRSAKLPNLSD